MVRAWKKGSRSDEAERERERHRSRTLSVFPDDDGMYVVRGRLLPEVGALLMRAIEAADDALFRERRAPGAAHDMERDAAQRRADAVGLLAERALAVGFQNESAEMPISGTRAERYQVMLHVERETLSAADETGRSELQDGTRVSAETSRRLSCDASIIRVTHGQDGSILDIGRKTRTISPGLRRALDVRDHGCRFPGCGLRFTDAHHVIHWADGGPTSLSNCLLLCTTHHRLVHEGGWRVEWWDNARPVFFDPRGGTHFDGSWKPPALPAHPVAALIEENERLGIEPDAWTASARWKREADIPDSVFFRALGGAVRGSKSSPELRRERNVACAFLAFGPVPAAPRRARKTRAYRGVRDARHDVKGACDGHPPSTSNPCNQDTNLVHVDAHARALARDRHQRAFHNRSTSFSRSSAMPALSSAFTSSDCA
jgi:hypothetical protein